MIQTKTVNIEYDREFVENILKGLSDPPKKQILEWTVNGITHCIESDEDRIDVHVGKLIDMFGHRLDYTIKDL